VVQQHHKYKNKKLTLPNFFSIFLLNDKKTFLNMEPTSKLKVIGVLAVVVILLMIGRSKDNASFVTESQPSHHTLKERQPELSTPMYYLVVGSFVDIENANTFGQLVESLNYQLYILPRTDGYVRVGIFTSPHRDVVVEYQKMSEGDFPKSWITYQ
jgi:hypothetical protein